MNMSWPYFYYLWLIQSTDQISHILPTQPRTKKRGLASCSMTCLTKKSTEYAYVSSFMNSIAIWWKHTIWICFLILTSLYPMGLESTRCFPLLFNLAVNTFSRPLVFDLQAELILLQVTENVTIFVKLLYSHDLK